MTFLRNLGRDLVDKKLWPLAVALLVALVAIPVVMGSKSETTPPPAVPGIDPGAAAAGSRAQVAVAEVDTTARNRAGKVRNPFQGPKLPKAQEEQPVEVDAGKSAGSAPDKAADTPSGPARTDSGSGGSPAPKVPTVKRPKAKAKADTESEPDIDERWVATLRFGVAGNKRKVKAIARLAPLPSSENPIIVFLGVLEDHKTAVFLVGSDADTTGDGTCRPSKTECETVRMTKGESQFFDVTRDDGAVIQYRLDLHSVRERKLSSKARTAAKARRRATASRSRSLEDTMELMGVAVANVPGLQVP